MELLNNSNIHFREIFVLDHLLKMTNSLCGHKCIKVHIDTDLGMITIRNNA